MPINLKKKKIDFIHIVTKIFLLRIVMLAMHGNQHNLVFNIPISKNIDQKYVKK